MPGYYVFPGGAVDHHDLSLAAAGARPRSSPPTPCWAWRRAGWAIWWRRCASASRRPACCWPGTGAVPGWMPPIRCWPRATPWPGARPASPCCAVSTGWTCAWTGSLIWITGSRRRARRVASTPAFSWPRRRPGKCLCTMARKPSTIAGSRPARPWRTAAPAGAASPPHHGGAASSGRLRLRPGRPRRRHRPGLRSGAAHQPLIHGAAVDAFLQAVGRNAYVDLRDHPMPCRFTPPMLLAEQRILNPALWH